MWARRPQAALASYHLLEKTQPKELAKLRGTGVPALSAAAGGGPSPEARCALAPAASGHRLHVPHTDSVVCSHHLKRQSLLSPSQPQTNNKTWPVGTWQPT